MGAARAGRLKPTARNNQPTWIAAGAAQERCGRKALCDRRNGAIVQYSRAGAAAKGVPNVAAVQKPLHRSRGSATLSVPGRPKRKSWFVRHPTARRLKMFHTSFGICCAQRGPCGPSGPLWCQRQLNSPEKLKTSRRGVRHPSPPQPPRQRVPQHHQPEMQSNIPNGPVPGAK